MCNLKWKLFLDKQTPFIQGLFYSSWNGELKVCDTCSEEFPVHSLFSTKHIKNRCRACLSNKKYEETQMAWNTIFEDIIPEGFKICTGCMIMLPMDSNHFTSNSSKKGFHSKCKLCRGFKQYGISDGKLNEKLIKEGKRKCKYCKEIKDISNFTPRGKTDVRIPQWCDDCHAVQKKITNSRASHPDKVKRKSEYDKVYYQKNREKRLKYRSEWKKTEHGQQVCSVLEAKRRHNKEKTLHHYSVHDWRESLDYFNHECAYCGIPEQKHKELYNQRLHQDHIIPVKLGGGYVKENIIPCCRNCNSSKKDKELEDFYERSEKFNLEKYLKVIDYIIDNT